MFNPEKLLGGLLRSGTRRKRGLGSLMSGGAALGLVGVAWEAVEHFVDKQQSSQSLSKPSGQSSPPPIPGKTSAPPPPPPGFPPSGRLAPADMKENEADSAEDSNQNAVLLIRAMIAAANADGVIDENERNQILNKLNAIDLSDEERNFVVHELLSPGSLDEIASQVRNADLAKQVYAVSLLAIDVDTDAERNYMTSLSKRLGLEDAAVESIHHELTIKKTW